MRRTTTVATPVAHLVGPGKLKVINGYLAFSAEGQAALRLDPQELRQLLCYGDVSVSDRALELLFGHEVQVAWLSPAGQRCRGRLVRSDPARAALRLLQHQVLAQPEEQLALARAVVAAKIASQQEAARHYQRHGCTTAGPVLEQLAAAEETCRRAAALDVLRGVEGAASAAWFGLLGQLLAPPWEFRTRSRRPPADPVNALLSLGYTWVLTRTSARCEAHGLELYLGALHDYRPGRPSLACDLMEPLRVPAVDRWAIAVLNGRELAVEDFVPEEKGGYRLKPEAFGRTMHKWETHWLQGGMDVQLDGLIQQLIRYLRQRDSSPSGPTGEGEAL